MNSEMIELSKRLIACKHFKWMPGMLWQTDDDCGRLDNYQPEYMGRPANALPCLTDPATIGCLVHLIRLAWKAPIDIHESRGAGNLWGISIVNQPLEDDCPYFTGYSQQEILVKAFEAAPIPYVLHEDEAIDLSLKWCPNCGVNAFIITWNTQIGKRYRCLCGLAGRFGDGTSEPLPEQLVEG